jgi:hypothetical protein
MIKGTIMLGALHRFRVAISILSLLAILFHARTAFAQSEGEGEGDLLDQARRMDRVAAQKVEADLRRALREAERLARVNRLEALSCLKRALALLEEDTVLSPERREALKRMLRDRIRVTLADGSDSSATDSDKKKPQSGRRAQEGVRPANEDPRPGLQSIQQLQGDGKTEAAAREASALGRQHPRDPAVQATEQTTRTADQVANARRLQQDREKRLASGHRDVEMSATPAGGDIDFPKDWKERTKGRTTADPLTAKEKSILQALNATISVNFKDSKLEDVIEYLQAYTGLAILLDREGMKDLEISYDTAVTLNVKGVTVRTLLRKILGDLGMTYVIKEETIQAISAQKAREMMVVRRYYVGDLLAGMSALGTPSGPQPGWPNAGFLPGGFPNVTGFPLPQAVNPQLQAMQKMESVKHLMELIQSSVEPPTWQVNGGSGTITFHASSMSLVIKQSAEVHALLGSGGLLR